MDRYLVEDLALSASNLVRDFDRSRRVLDWDLSRRLPVLTSPCFCSPDDLVRDLERDLDLDLSRRPDFVFSFALDDDDCLDIRLGLCPRVPFKHDRSGTTFGGGVGGGEYAPNDCISSAAGVKGLTTVAEVFVGVGLWSDHEDEESSVADVAVELLRI